MGYGLLWGDIQPLGVLVGQHLYQFWTPKPLGILHFIFINLQHVS
jgi:hypothetical protein